ncbi:MAG: exonuclease SbcCD subunit D C-terminal domain-containing protein [Saprospiraceae bacterium]|nr:exonuclease SbcCD subunit D C-terminal domain-containing protein [Saprospiraceae bacterium]
MKILHTADWHLGQKFFHRDRKKEHQAALDWLADYIIEQEVELLLIAGDIFDTDSPPNYARKMYFNFMRRLVDTCCKDIIVVAGNHDSPNMLDASKELFALINVHVVGHIPKDRTEQIIEIKDNTGKLKAVIGAVPYLRDKDIRKSAAGESSEQRVENIRKGITQHYLEIDDALQTYYNQDIPIIVTGHLYVAGSQRGERPNTIHIGSLDIVDASIFPENFTYIALGHLHRPQKVDRQDRIRYSGALIPLDFSELNYDQVVKLVHFSGKELERIQWVKVPKLRKLRHYTGTIEEIKERLSGMDKVVNLPTWVKVDLLTDTYLPNLADELNALIEGDYAELFVCNQRSTQYLVKEEAEELPIRSLADITPLEVFELCLEQRGVNEEKEKEELVDSFKELISWMKEQDKE